jgi:aarF domain-containing kinase
MVKGWIECRMQLNGFFLLLLTFSTIGFSAAVVRLPFPPNAVSNYRRSDVYNAKKRLDRALHGGAPRTLQSSWNLEPFQRAIFFWSRAGPIVLHYQFTQWWIRNRTKEQRHIIYEGLHNAYCEPSLKICLHLQGLFTKIGQVLSARPDFVPHQYVELLATVQDSIPQWPFDQVKDIMEVALHQNQGLRWEDVFEEVDGIALGSASIGQCHRAVLKSPWDSRFREVAVKVMHPNAEARFRHDFKIFKWLCRIALPGWKPILDELQKQMMTEFDYNQEARNLEEVSDNMMVSPYRDKIAIPRPIFELCSKNLLVMEYLPGKKLVSSMEERLASAIGNKEAAKAFLKQKQKDLVQGKVAVRDKISDVTELIAFCEKSIEHEDSTFALSRWMLYYKLVMMQRHFKRTVQTLLDVHGHQIFLNRVFNGDCHPGNILELSNGKIGLIDYGQTKRLTEKEAISIAKIVSELGHAIIDTRKVATAMRECGFQTKWDKDDVLTMYAKLFFDSDDEAKAEGCATPQMYLMKLSSLDPLLHVPDAAIFTARTSYLFRGMGSLAGEHIKTSKYWKKHADQLLNSV